MFGFIKKTFIGLLSFNGFLATKCVLFNNEPCMVRPTLMDLDPVELNYFTYMISLDKYSGSCNVVDDLP